MKREEWREDSPIGLRRFGKDFITVGLDALSAHRVRYPLSPLDLASGEIIPEAIYYNFLHGVELGLKSYLRHIDAVSIRDLRSHLYGHNLCRLLDKSIQHGLRAKCPKLTRFHLDTIRCANELYMPKEFEYIRIGFAQVPIINAVKETAEVLFCGLNRLPMQPAKQPIS